MAKQLYIDFDEYIRQGEPEAAISAEQWKTAMGLQAVDGMKPSQYLVDVARRNIEGDITMDEVQELLHSYYACATNRDKIEENDEEADKASANIKRILSTNTLAFNTNGYIATHRRIFEGVFKHAGQLRQYDISKKEWVLHGDTVNYLNWEDLRRALDYDIQQEKDFSYKGLSDDEKIKHICRFTSGLWQIHPFCEGNTRATAVFLIQYLRSIGYTVTNDMFAEHSWYFRNALVRANYKNLAQGIDYELVYLERFLRNMLLGEQWVLKNRYLIINPPEEFKEQPRLDEVQQIEKLGKNTDVLLKKLGRKAEKFGVKLGKNKIAILRLVMTNPFVSTTQMAKELSITTTAIDNNIKQMRDILLRHVGPKKGGHWEICEQED
ncbi:Fic family protein [Sodaliphilus sp.]|uniref:Fic family protein n=1 Tax=Sodaliphilus sp. TaxID=2815818 RepID=UPI00388D739C